MQSLETTPLLVDISHITLRLTHAEFEQMLEYQANGVRLGWLINPQQQEVEIYRLGQAVEVLKAPQTLDGEDVLPGFMFDFLSSIQLSTRLVFP